MEQEIKKSLEILRAGGVILYPTDTVWGLGCDATNENAVKKIFGIKEREESKSLIVLVSDENQLNRYVKNVPEIAWELIEASEKPITIIYPDVSGLANNLIAEDKSLGIRIPEDEFCKKLLLQFKKPIVSTSANISGDKTPGNFSDISEQLKEKVDYVVKWRQQETQQKNSSSIIKLSSKGEIEILRK